MCETSDIVQVGSAMTEKKPIDAIIEHLKKLHEQIGHHDESGKFKKSDMTSNIYITGDVAINYYTGYRMFNNIDFKSSLKILIPSNLQVFKIEDTDSEMGYSIIHMNGGNFKNSTLRPPDWESKCLKIESMDNMVVHVIDPNDLVVSRISEFENEGREDIQELARSGLLDLDIIKSRFNEAIQFYYGAEFGIECNAKKAFGIIEDILNNSDLKTNYPETINKKGKK